MASVLALVQDFATLKGLPVPTALVGATELTAKQLLGVAQEAVEDLVVFNWPDQQKRVTFNSTTDELQGNTTTLFGTGYSRLIPQTMWDTTDGREIPEAGGSVRYQAAKSSMVGASPIFCYRVMGGNLYFYPAPTAVHAITVMVGTNLGITDSTGVTAKERFTVDTDIPLFPSNVFKAEVEWRWLKRKDEAWAAAAARAQALRQIALGAKGHLPIIDMSDTQAAAKPGVWVPAGSWDV